MYIVIQPSTLTPQWSWQVCQNDSGRVYDLGLTKTYEEAAAEAKNAFDYYTNKNQRNS